MRAPTHSPATTRAEAISTAPGPGGIGPGIPGGIPTGNVIVTADLPQHPHHSVVSLLRHRMLKGNKGAWVRLC
jgi:hypothetical protein